MAKFRMVMIYSKNTKSANAELCVLSLIFRFIKFNGHSCSTVSPPGMAMIQPVLATRRDPQGEGRAFS